MFKRYFLLGGVSRIFWWAEFWQLVLGVWLQKKFTVKLSSKRRLDADHEKLPNFETNLPNHYQNFLKFDENFKCFDTVDTNTSCLRCVWNHNSIFLIHVQHLTLWDFCTINLYQFWRAEFCLGISQLIVIV